MTSYKSYQNFKSWMPESFGQTTIEESKYFEKEFQLVKSSNLNNMLVVEIGFGNGSFTSWATKKGCDYRGFELIPELVIVATELGFKVYDSEIPFEEVVSDESVDYVVAWDVFEHLDTDQITLKFLECFKALKPGGRLMARVPSGDSPFSGPLQNGDFTHKTCLGSSKVRQISIATGFVVESIRAPALPIWGMGLKTFCRRALVTIAQKTFYPFLKNIFMGGGDVVLTQNMIFVLRKPY
ncbi:MAG: hypothetical protein CMK41_06685 [Porticoccaceae bacterium]|nr:hypothetical protein [Porticoccaceae bacterium]|tara:strand:+ start:177 stop:893 length:717 start_codon:yes stop_codon:yes gene_type:complete